MIELPSPTGTVATRASALDKMGTPEMMEGINMMGYIAALDPERQQTLNWKTKGPESSDQWQLEEERLYLELLGV